MVNVFSLFSYQRLISANVFSTSHLFSASAPTHDRKWLQAFPAPTLFRSQWSTLSTWSVSSAARPATTTRSLSASSRRRAPPCGRPRSSTTTACTRLTTTSPWIWLVSELGIAHRCRQHVVDCCQNFLQIAVCNALATSRQ